MNDLLTKPGGRRRFLKGLAAAAAGVGVLSTAAGCREDEVAEVVAQATEAPEVKETAAMEAKPAAVMEEIDWWYGWGGMVSNDMLNAVAEAFNASQGLIRVKPVQVSGMTEKLLTSIAGGNPPAVETGNIVVAEFWTRGAATPLDDMVKTSTILNLDNFFETSIKQGQWKGVQYGVPAIECYLRWGLGVNEKVATEANLDLSNPPRTLEEMLEWAEAMTSLDGAGNVATLGFDPMDAMGGSFGGGDPFLWGPMFGFDYWDTENLKYNLNNPSMIRVLEHIRDIYEIVGADKIEGFRKSYGTWSESPTSSFPAGVQGSVIEGYWSPGELSKSSIDPDTEQPRKFAWNWVYMPEERKDLKIQGTGGHFGMLPKGSPNPEAGFAYIEYLNTEAAVDVIFDASGWLPAQPSLVAKQDASRYRGLDFFIKSQDEATLWGGEHVDPIQGFVTDLWREKTAAVYFNKQSAADAVEEWQNLADSELKERFPDGI